MAPDMVVLLILIIAVSLPCLSSTSSGDGDKLDGLSQGIVDLIFRSMNFDSRTEA